MKIKKIQELNKIKNEMSRDVLRFLESGGKIELVPAGLSGIEEKPLKRINEGTERAKKDRARMEFKKNLFKLENAC